MKEPDPLKTPKDDPSAVATLPLAEWKQVLVALAMQRDRALESARALSPADLSLAADRRLAIAIANGAERIAAVLRAQIQMEEDARVGRDAWRNS